MNELSENQSKEDAPVNITEDIQVSLNRLGRDLETHAESGIRIGKELIHLKEITPHGKFGELVEWAYGLKRTMREDYINVALKYGENPACAGFSNRVLIELSRPSTPESVRESASQEESLTVKQAKELKDAHKRIEELESPRQPNLDNLVPALMKKYKGASITIGMANRLSVLDEGQQNIFLSLFESKQSEEKQNKELTNEKLEALENLAKATRERDEIQAELEKVSETDTASVLVEKEKELEQMQKDYDRRVKKQRKEADKEASNRYEKQFKDQIDKAEKAAEKAKRDEDEIRKDYLKVCEDEQKAKREAKALEKQLEVKDSTNVDLSRAKSIQNQHKLIKSEIIQLQTDMTTYGGDMRHSLDALNNVVSDIQSFCSQYDTTYIDV